MPKPIKWRDLVRRLRTMGWGPPEGGGKHPVMWKSGQKLVLPNPHKGDSEALRGLVKPRFAEGKANP